MRYFANPCVAETNVMLRDELNTFFAFPGILWFHSIHTKTDLFIILAVSLLATNSHEDAGDDDDEDDQEQSTHRQPDDQFDLLLVILRTKELHETKVVCQTSLAN